VQTGDLSQAERAVRDAFGHGHWTDLSGADDPVVRAEVLASLLLHPAEPSDGEVPALRLRGARITGVLDIAFGTVTAPLQLDACTLEGGPDLTGASTRSVELTGCTLPGLSARLARVEGDLRVSGCRVRGCLLVKNATVTGSASLSASHLANPGGRAVDGGGFVVGGGLVGRRGMRAEGSIRIIGARIEGGVLLEGARISNPGGVALCADELITTRLLCSHLDADGEVQLRNAKVSGEASLHGAKLRAGVKAVRARGLSAAELFLTPASVQGMVDLSRARIGALRDSAATWPPLLRLDGLSYDHLIPFDDVDARRRCAWLTRDVDEYRPQPYEQLAAYYRRLGHDHDARRVLLAKQRVRRSTLRLPARAGGHLLDLLVGYGYRPWLAAVWLLVLLGAGTTVFHSHPPLALDPGHQPHFDAFVYTVDLLIPIGAFGLRAAYDPAGWTRWVAYALIAAGWILATALVAGVSRSVRRD
jgi:hypothetical protein